MNEAQLRKKISAYKKMINKLENFILEDLKDAKKACTNCKTYLGNNYSGSTASTTKQAEIEGIKNIISAMCINIENIILPAAKRKKESYEDRLEKLLESSDED